jgi:hypothetical protein
MHFHPSQQQMSRVHFHVMTAIAVTAAACFIAVAWDMLGEFDLTVFTLMYAYGIAIIALGMFVTIASSAPAWARVAVVAAFAAAIFTAGACTGPLMALNVFGVGLLVAVGAGFRRARRWRRGRLFTPEEEDELAAAWAVGAPAGLRLIVITSWSKSVYRLSAMPWSDGELPMLPIQEGADGSPDSDRWVAVVVGPKSLLLERDAKLEFAGVIPEHGAGEKLTVGLAVVEDSDGDHWVLNHDALEHLRSHHGLGDPD